MMRHRKDQSFNGRQPLLQLPKRFSETVLVEWGTEIERNTYERLFRVAKQMFLDMIKEGTAAQQQMVAMSLLLPVRMACAPSTCLWFIAFLCSRAFVCVCVCVMACFYLVARDIAKRKVMKKGWMNEGRERSHSHSRL